MLSRRNTIQVLGSTASFASLSGCIGLFERGRVGVRIENRDDREHTFGVTFEDEAEAVFSEEYTLGAGAESSVDDAVPPGAYQATVALDSSTTETVAFGMNGCTSNSLFVAVHEDGTLEASVLDEC